jgi:hypothetical protein
MKNTKVLSGIAMSTIAVFLVTAMVATTSDALGATSVAKTTNAKAVASTDHGAFAFAKAGNTIALAFIGLS